MWYAPPQRFSAVPSPRKSVIDPDAHAHSPRRRGESQDMTKTTPAMLPLPPAMWNPEARDSQWSPLPLLADPFTEDAPFQSHYNWAATRVSTSTGDQSMPDYSHSATPASSRHQSNHGEVPNLLSGNADSQFDELMAAFSPHREMTGTYAPTNTRVSSAANTPSKHFKPSAAAEARAASYSHVNARSVSVTTRDPQQPPPQIRDSSDVSMKSNFSTQKREQSVKAKPAAEIKSRKEGRSGEDGVSLKASQRKSSVRPIKTEEKAEEKVIIGNDSKRKRSSIPAGQKIPIENLLSSSPTRKVSRVEGKGERQGSGVVLDLTEGLAMRNPLGDLGNVQ